MTHLLEPGDCNEGDVRFVNGTVIGEGRLEICAMGIWGRICAQNFRRSSARIACQQMHIEEVEGMYIFVITSKLCSYMHT